MANQKASCKGKPSATFYSNGCRCAGCREAWRVHSVEFNASKRKNSKYKADEIKKPVQPKSGNRDKPIVFADAFTREEIIKARAEK